MKLYKAKSFTETIDPDDPRYRSLEQYEVRRQPVPASHQDNGQLYLWLFLGVPGAFIGAYKAFKRHDDVMGRRLTKIGVAILIGFCLFFGFISWRISENTNRLLEDFDNGASSFNATDLVPGVVEGATLQPINEVVAEGAVYVTLHPSDPIIGSEQSDLARVLTLRLQDAGISGSVQCLGSNIIVTIDQEKEAVRGVDVASSAADLPGKFLPETVGRTRPTEVANVGCD